MTTSTKILIPDAVYLAQEKIPMENPAPVTPYPIDPWMATGAFVGAALVKAAGGSPNKMIAGAIAGGLVAAFLEYKMGLK